MAIGWRRRWWRQTLLGVLVLAAVGCAGRLPEVSLATPASGTAVHGNVLLLAAVDAEQVLATELGAVRFEYAKGPGVWTVIATPVVPVSVGGPWQTVWNTADLAPGEYRLRAALAARDGRTTTTPEVAVRLRKAPVARLRATPLEGKDAVWLDAAESGDPDGQVVQWNWAFGDGTRRTGPTIERAYPPSTKRDRLVLSVKDSDGLEDHAYAWLEIDPVSHHVLLVADDQCTCTSVELRGDKLPDEVRALGPDAEAAGQDWPDRFNKTLDGVTLGPLKNNPKNTVGIAGKIWNGYAFEVVFRVRGDPKLCKEGQLIKGSLTTVFRNPNVGKRKCGELYGEWVEAEKRCRLTTTWRGTSVDRDQNGTDDLVVDSTERCVARGGTWDGQACRLKFRADGEEFGPDEPRYDKEYDFKKHVKKEGAGSAIIWTDAPRCQTSGNGAMICERYQYSILGFVRGTDQKYCYVKFTGDVERQADQSVREEITNLEEKTDQDRLPGVSELL